MPGHEAWLRGPIGSVPVEVMHVAHALTQCAEDIDRALAGFDPSWLWTQPAGAASVGFHLTHLTGATDRLFSYADGRSLSPEQRAALEIERAGGDEAQDVASLTRELRSTIAHSIKRLESLDPASLDDARALGAAELPTSVRGLLTHAAEHAARHAGQIVTTAKILEGTAQDRC